MFNSPCFINFLWNLFKIIFSWLIGIYASTTYIAANNLSSHLVNYINDITKDKAFGFNIMYYMILCSLSQIWILALSHFILDFLIFYIVFFAVLVLLLYIFLFLIILIKNQMLIFLILKIIIQSKIWTNNKWLFWEKDK